VIVLAVYIAGSFLDVLRRLRLDRQANERLFKANRLKQIARLLLFIVPILFGCLYFVYNHYWRYAWNRFGRDEVGVLIADFREVLLTDYVPQKKYSTYLKEKLPELEISCNKNIKVRFQNTSAFFTSGTEAKAYGEKVNAYVVIWGEVFKTEGIISIRPKLTTPGYYDWRIADTDFNPFTLLADYAEDWSITGAPLNLDTMLIFFNDFLVAPVVSKMKEIGVSKEEFVQYAKCCLLRENYLPEALRGMLAFEIGERSFRDSVYDTCIIWMREAFAHLSRDQFIRSEINWIRAYCLRNIAVCYYALGVQDSCLEYTKRSAKTEPEFILRENVFNYLFCNGEFPTLLEGLMVLWDETRDSIIGDHLLDLHKTTHTTLGIRFRNEYEMKYPGRYDRLRGGRILKCIDSSKI
jgi:hypothetical protein